MWLHKFMPHIHLKTPNNCVFSFFPVKLQYLLIVSHKKYILKQKLSLGKKKFAKCGVPLSMRRFLEIFASSENKGREQGLMCKHMQRLVGDVMAMRTEEKTIKFCKLWVF